MQEVHTLTHPVSSFLSSMGNAWLHKFQNFPSVARRRGDPLDCTHRLLVSSGFLIGMANGLRRGEALGE